MELNEWIQAPTLQVGSMEDIIWEIVAQGASVPNGPQELGRRLRAAGWTRVIGAKGRKWYAPGIAKESRTLMIERIWRAMGNVLRERRALTVGELKDGVRASGVTYDDVIFGSCISRRIKRGDIDLGDRPAVGGGAARMVTWKRDLDQVI